MDAKITLSLDETVMKKAQHYAEIHKISLSKLTEFLLRHATSNQYLSLEELPVSDWVSMVAEGKAEYKTKPRKNKDTKAEFFKSKK